MPGLMRSLVGPFIFIAAPGPEHRRARRKVAVFDMMISNEGIHQTRWIDEEVALGQVVLCPKHFLTVRAYCEFR